MNSDTPIAAKAVIAEDEQHLRQHLRALLQAAWPELDICAEAANGRAALDAVARHRPQIAFLDIRMPGLSGMEVARHIAGQCHLVFVTAFDAYAVEAFERQAVDYLLKPVTPERLARTVERLKSRIADRTAPSPDIASAVESILGSLEDKAAGTHLQWLQVKQSDGLRLLPVAEVVYFQAGDKYTEVVTPTEKALIRTSIRQLTTSLDPRQFWRIHRGTIVNVGRIHRVSRSVTGRGIIKLIGRPETLTVSRRYLHLFKQM